ncbi:MAG: ATP-binding protein [Thermodesulfobacteriota bacterium]
MSAAATPQPPAPPHPQGPSHPAFRWLLRLRWGAVGCQLFLIGVVSLLFAIEIPLPILFAIVGFEIASNMAFHLRLRQGAAVADSTFALVLFLDIVMLTALLYYTGGPMNPFTLLYLVHITLAAILVGPLWSWTIALLTVVAYSALFFLPRHEMAAHDLGTPTLNDLLGLCHQAPPGIELLRDPMAVHLQGMLAALAVSAFFIVFFVGRIRKALDEQQRTLADLREQKLRNEKLASLATLAAGAAHEFSTPLATIAVAAGEMYHSLRAAKGDPELLGDAALIRSQVDRCREILYHMAADAGEHLGETVEEFTVQEAVDQCLRSLPPEAKGRVVVSNQAGGLTVRMPLRTLSRIVRGLLKNGLDASPPPLPVTLVCRCDAAHLLFEVRDQGYGMSGETLARAGEPFFTTKEAGRGLGLGLFLARSAAERFGGRLLIDSLPGEGTTVRLSFALSQILPPTA